MLISAFLLTLKESNFSNSTQNYRHRLSVWRLKRATQKSGEGAKTVLELVHQEILPRSPFTVAQSYVNRNFIFFRFLRPLKGLFENVFEIRSVADFTIIHTFEKEILPPTSHFLRFFNNDILAMSVLRSGELSKIK